jgi:hypothetical protein
MLLTRDSIIVSVFLVHCIGGDSWWDCKGAIARDCVSKVEVAVNAA